jgi:small-conductance mechanosensitive channel
MFRGVVEDIATGVAEATPRIVLGLMFVAVAYVAIKAALSLIRRGLRRAYGEEQRLVADLLTTVAGVFAWFGAALVLLNIIGMGQIAASLGTATGFVALGVSYALSGMIADTVAGVYLLRDPDFNAGDTVEAGGVEGVVRSIELRKTRFEVDGDTVVVSNSKVEKEWTLVDGS